MAPGRMETRSAVRPSVATAEEERLGPKTPLGVRKALRRTLWKQGLRAESLKRQALERFGSLVVGLGEQDLNFLCSLDNYGCRIRVFDLGKKSRVATCDGGLPDLEWPIVWRLCRHSPRHSFTNLRSVSREEARRRLQLFERKMSWSWLRRHSDAAPALRAKGLERAPYTRPRPPPELRAWVGELLKAVLRCHKRGKQSLHGARYWRPLHALAAELSARPGYRIAALDK
jgi:hypothetical protein